MNLRVCGKLITIITFIRTVTLKTFILTFRVGWVSKGRLWMPVGLWVSMGRRVTDRWGLATGCVFALWLCNPLLRLWLL